MRRGRVRNVKNHNIKSRRKTVVKPKVAPKPVKITALPASVLPAVAIKRTIAPKVTKKVIAKQKAATKAVAKKNQT